MTTYFVINSNDSGVGSLRYGMESKLYTLIILTGNLSKIILSSSILISTNITINNFSPTYIQCNNYSIFTLVDSNITFNISANKTLFLVDSISANQGGAINNIFNNNTINLSNVNIINCSAQYGGGIFTFGPLILKNCIINNNIAFYVGAGIFSCNSINIDKCVFSRNIVVSETTYIGGAGLFIYADTNSSGLTFDISNTTISNNFIKYNPLQNTGASGAGIMILIFDNIINFNNCIIENNLSKNGSGIMVVNGNVTCSDTILQNNISANYAEQQDPRIKPVTTGGGCGITSMAGTVEVNNCSIQNNKSYGMYSSGIVGFSGDVTCNNSNISNNINAGPGGGIAVNLNCNLIIGDSIISNNLASGLGGAIINFSNNTFNTNITNCSITYNQLDNRENLLSAYQNIIGTTETYINYFIDFIINITSRLNIVTGIVQNIYDIILFFEELVGIYASKIISSSVIINNYGNFIGGGAICIFNDCNLTIQNSNILHNNIVINIKESYGITDYIACGGAIFSILSNNISISNTIIQYNQCNGIAGGIYNNGPLLNITDSDILNNLLILDKQCTLDQNGGAIYISPNIALTGIANSSTTNITTSLIHNNICLSYGGGIYNGGGDVNLNNTYIYSNITDDIYESNDLSFPNIPTLTNTESQTGVYYNYTYIENIPNPKYPYPLNYASIYDASGKIQWIFVGSINTLQYLIDSKDPFVQLMTTPTLINHSPQMLIGTIPSNFVLNINNVGSTVYYVNSTHIPNVDIWFFVKKESFYLDHQIYNVVVQKFYPTLIVNPYTIYDTDPNGAKYVYFGVLKNILAVYYTDILVKTVFINPVIIKGYYTPPLGKKLFYQNNDPVYTTVQIWFISPISVVTYNK